jgi:hypothetical protein
MRRLLAFIAITLVFTSAASASTVSFDKWSVGLEAAAMTWGGMPPCGTPTFKHHDNSLPTDYADMWVNSDTGPGTTLADLQSDDCVIHVAESAEAENAGDECAEVVHEVGHLWGRDHSKNSHSIMFGDGVTIHTKGAWACRRLLQGETVVFCPRKGSPQYSEGACNVIRKYVPRVNVGDLAQDKN